MLQFYKNPMDFKIKWRATKDIKGFSLLLSCFGSLRSNDAQLMSNLTQRNPQTAASELHWQQKNGLIRFECDRQKVGPITFRFFWKPSICSRYSHASISRRFAVQLKRLQTTMSGAQQKFNDQSLALTLLFFCLICTTQKSAAVCKTLAQVFFCFIKSCVAKNSNKIFSSLWFYLMFLHKVACMRQNFGLNK